MGRLFLSLPRKRFDFAFHCQVFDDFHSTVLGGRDNTNAVSVFIILPGASPELTELLFAQNRQQPYQTFVFHDQSFCLFINI